MSIVPTAFVDKQSLSVRYSSTADESTYIGNTFQAVSKFRKIIAEILVVYNVDNDSRPVVDRVPLLLAERKYQELLTLADGLAAAERRCFQMPQHVMVLQ